MSDKAFFVDSTICMGCKSCQSACKQWNNLPGKQNAALSGYEYTSPVSLSADTWNHVFFSSVEMQPSEKPLWNIIHKKCFHCKKANCVAACPQKAISRVDGWTIIDQEKCIGSGECRRACAYKVPGISEKEHKNITGDIVLKKGKAYKCDACSKYERDIPLCVSNCPTGALKFGYRIAILVDANKKLKSIKKEYPHANVYGIHEFGGLRVIYLLKDKPEKFDLPVGVEAEPRVSLYRNGTNDIYEFLSIFTFGIPSFKRTAYRIAKYLDSGDV